MTILQEDYHELERAMAKLKPIKRLSLLMAANGATGEEIASHLGRSHGATRTLLCSARMHLRAAIVEAEEAAAQRGTILMTHGTRSIA